MSFLIISIVVNCLVLIVSAQEEAVATASVSTDSVPASFDSSASNEFKPRFAAKVYNECGTACPLTCAQPKQRPCVFICKADWFCPKDYYENSSGQCVLLEDCDSASSTPSPPKHLPGHIVGRPKPRPRPFPFPGLRPAPFQRPIMPANYTGFAVDEGRIPDFPNFPNFNLTETELPKLYIPLGPPRPRPIFQINPVGYDATAVANGAPIPPPAMIRTSGSNLPYLGLSMVPKSKPLIDLDPTVPRPVSRVSQEESSDADN